MASINGRNWHGHYLSRNHSNRRPSSFVFVDVETKQESIKGNRDYLRHTLQLGVACSVTWKKDRDQKEQWLDFTDADLFWQWLLNFQNQRQVLWVVAHNAMFDMSILGLWNRLGDGLYKTESPPRTYCDPRTGKERTSAGWKGLTAIDGSPFHVETLGPKGRVNFTDLQNYYSSSLAQIADMVGCTKGVWDENKGDKLTLLSYCRNDVEITKRAYLDLVKRWEDEGNGNWQFSAASLAFSHYRHKYMDNKIIIHNNASALNMEWDSLYGGEVRSFFSGSVDKELVHYDVNSLYPSIMVGNSFPTALVDVILEPPLDYAVSLMSRYCCVAQVAIDTDDDIFPKRMQDRIVYPTGQFCTTLTGPELWSAVDGRNIRKIYEMALYTYADIFDKYVLEWWHEKQSCKRKGDESGEKFAKLMLNSLPAKFAQRTPVWEPDDRVDVVRPWSTFPHRDATTGTIFTARAVGWVGQVQRHRKPTENAFPLIYAYVTSYARERMRTLRGYFPVNSVYYQDTDSIIADAESARIAELNGLPVGDELGQMRVIGRYKSAEFRGLKNYTVDGRDVIAGIRSRDKQDAKMVWGGTRFEKTSHLFCRHPDESLREYFVTIETPGRMSEGTVYPSGWTEPIKIGTEIATLPLN